jgi:hypothetical protein
MQLQQSGSFVDAFNPLGATLTMSGIAPEVGMIIKPDDLPFRIGATFRSTVNGSDLGHANTTTDSQGVVRSGGIIVPSSVTLPWEFETGFALQVGPRPLNPSWIDPHEEIAPVRAAVDAARARRAAEHEAILAEIVPAHRAERRRELEEQEAAIRAIEAQALATEEKALSDARKARYQNWPREKILVVASVLITGESTNAIALEDFFDQKLEQYGNNVSVSPRVGIEGEPIRNWVKARLGSYLEPSRFDGIAARQHFTFGGDLKLLPWNGFGLFNGRVWMLSAACDLAPRYVDWGLSIGAWH